MSRFLAFLTGLALAALLAAHVPAPRPLGMPNAAAPPQSGQFGFLVGEWRCAMTRLQEDGTLWTAPEAHWTGYWILDGWAIQDDWSAPGPDGTLLHGTTVRAFNPRTAAWDVRRLAAGTLQWSAHAAVQVGDTMVTTGRPSVDAHGRPILDRDVFYDITPDAWKWRQDRSFDAGATWIEGVVEIEARRVR